MNLRAAAIGQCLLVLLMVLTGAPLARAAAAPAPAPTPAPAPSADPGSQVVARVDGTPITLGQVEDALLRREGVEELQEWIEHTFTSLDWSRVPEEAELLIIGSSPLYRRDLVTMLARHAGTARADLIEAAVVQDALAQAGLVIDAQAADAAWASMKHDFESHHHDGSRYIDFASFLQATQHVSEEQFRHQPHFLTVAGLRLLAVRDAQAHEPEAAVQAYFDAHHQRWDQPEAAQLAEIYIDAGKDPEQQMNAVGVLAGVWRSIKGGHETLADAWEALGKSYDPDAQPGGAIGWIPRSGQRAKPTSPAIPALIMDKVFSPKTTPLPYLLPPLLGPEGAFLVRVDARRPAVPAQLAAVRPQVIAAMVEDDLQPRMSKTMEALRAQAQIHTEDLAPLLAKLQPTPPLAPIDSGSTVVATVNGHPLMLRQLDDEVLRRYGADLLQEWAGRTFAGLDWAHLDDGVRVLSVSTKHLTRGELVAELLKHDGSQARKDLIELQLVRDAIARSRVQVDAAALAQAWSCMEAEFVQDHPDEAAHVSFADYIRRTEHLTPEEFRAQVGFQLFASLRLLVIADASAHEPEAQLQAFFQEHRDRYDIAEGVHLTALFHPFSLGDPLQRQAATTLIEEAEADVRSHRRTFAQVWSDALGGTWDPEAGPGGDIGWIPRDGHRSRASSPRLPPTLLAQAFAHAQGPFPVLLPAEVGDALATLVEVDGYRSAQTATYATARPQVVADEVMGDLKKRMDRLMDDLRRQATIEYESLSEAVARAYP